MLTKEKLLEMLSDVESYHVERTVSTDNMDKFCQAICAFANFDFSLVTAFRVIEGMFGISARNARYHLQKLAESGLIERQGQGRATRWVKRKEAI